MDHTPEPWDCAKMDGVVHVYSPRMSLSVCKMTDVMTIGQFENARRIVACVNACKGWATEDLEERAVFDELLFDKKKAEADRDRWKALAVEVIPVLMEVLDASESLEPQVWSDMLDNVDKAIGKIQKARKKEAGE